MPARSRFRKALLLAMCTLVGTWAFSAERLARAEEPKADTQGSKPDPTFSAAEQKRLLTPPSGDIDLFGTLAFGDGLRFNNPYRLHTQLGSTAKSLSLTAPYTDFGAAITFGKPNSLQHGLALHTGVALSGPQQTYLSLSYLAAYRASHSFMLCGRIGPNLLLSPDPNLGGELAGSFSYFITGSLGLTSEIAFDLFYGAATLDKTFTIYPILSGQLGIIVNYEVLP